MKLPQARARSPRRPCSSPPRAAHAQPATYKVAYIDPLSGPFANVGELMLAHLRYAVDDINAKGGVPGGTEDAAAAVRQQALGAGKPERAAGGHRPGRAASSSPAARARRWWRRWCSRSTRWNERNPGKELIVLNHSSIDPDLTGKDCSFWHFQTDANTAMKMKAIANYIKKTPEIKKVYLLNQDYAHGKQWAGYGRQMVGTGAARHPVRRRDAAPDRPREGLRALRRQHQADAAPIRSSPATGART